MNNDELNLYVSLTLAIVSTVFIIYILYNKYKERGKEKEIKKGNEKHIKKKR